MNRLMILIFLLAISCKSEKTMEIPIIGLSTDNVIDIDGLEREYHLFVPENYSNQPLVILLHGNGGSHDDIAGISSIKSPFKVWLEVAEQNDLLVVIPNGTLGSNERRGWNDCRTDASGNSTADDVKFIDDLLNKIKSEYDFNENKVYVTGISNGGHMSFRLAQELPERITAFASIAASTPVNSSCVDSSIPVSALFMNGTDDPLSPYSGGEIASNRGTVLSTQESVNYWVTRNGTSSNPITENIPDINTNDGCTAIKYLYESGNNNTEVAHYEIIGGGHTEPSIKERYSNLFLLVVGNQSGDFEMAEEIWNFFRTKSK